MTYRHFFRDLQTLEKFSSRTHISTKSVCTNILLCVISVCFLHKSLHLERKKCMRCIFAVILMFLLPSDHAENKISVNHANEIWKYIMTFILFKITDFAEPSTQKVRNLFCTMCKEIKKRCAKVSVSHKMLAHAWNIVHSMSMHCTAQNNQTCHASCSCSTAYDVAFFME